MGNDFDMWDAPCRASRYQHFSFYLVVLQRAPYLLTLYLDCYHVFASLHTVASLSFAAVTARTSFSKASLRKAHSRACNRRVSFSKATVFPLPFDGLPVSFLPAKPCNVIAYFDALPRGATAGAVREAA